MGGRQNHPIVYCLSCLCHAYICFVVKQSFHVQIYFGHFAWASWRLKSPATWLFPQKIVQAKSKRNIKTPHYSPFLVGCGYPQVTDGFPYRGPVMQKAFLKVLYTFHVGGGWNSCGVIWCPMPWNRSGPRLNIKTVLSTYGDFHVKDKTAVRTSYL